MLPTRNSIINYLKNKCSKCGTENIWMGEPLTLQLHHISGDATDNRLENLTMLCLNCHSHNV